MLCSNYAAFRSNYAADERLCFQYNPYSSYILNFKPLGHFVFNFCLTDYFSQQNRVGGRNKNKNKIHTDRFPIEFKSKETRNRFSFDFN